MFKYIRRKRTTGKDSTASTAPHIEMNARKTSPPSDEDWQTINWKRANKLVLNLQKRIYNASKNGNTKKAASLMRLLMRSTSNTLVSVRKVTQDNKGKKSPGIDGKVYLTPANRAELASELLTLSRNKWRKYKAKPARRRYIPKKGGKKRPLGLLVLKDRALQAVALNACDPYFEAQHDEASYGFRKGYSAKDAIELIFKNTKYVHKWVFEGDIAGCFDNIDFEAVLKHFSSFPTVKRLVNQWLKAGVIDKNTFAETTKGTPQGGIISPLLANIALNGLESYLKEKIKATLNLSPSAVRNLRVVRYADDFVVLHDRQEVIELCPKLTKEWLAERGLNLAFEKCRIVHTSQGFDFLGFNVRRYELRDDGKWAYLYANRIKQRDRRRKAKKGKTQKRQYDEEHVTLITPSKKSLKKVGESIKEVIKSNRAAKQGTLINKLNSKIIGWANYYRGVASKRTFNTLDHLIWEKLWKWSVRRHPNKGKKWVADKYFRTIGKYKWHFSDGKNTLALASDVKIVRHTPVRLGKSYYDGDELYWASRLSGGYGSISPSLAKLLKKQGGRCAFCNGVFRHDEAIEKHHIIPKKDGVNNSYQNLVALHRHCHDQYHALWEQHLDEKRKTSQKLATPYRVMSKVQAMILGKFQKG